MDDEPISQGQLVSSDLPELRAGDALPARSSPVHYALVGRTSTTRRTYLSRLNQVATVFGFPGYDALPWQQLRYEHLKYLVARMTDEHKSPATINTTLGAVRAVMHSAFMLRLLSGDDLARINSVKMSTGERLPAGRVVPSGEILALVQHCEKDPSPAGIRDIAMLGLLCVCGLRRDEIARLSVDHYDRQDNSLTFIGKNNKQRRAYPDAGTQAALLDWLRVRGAWDGPLFCPILKSGRILLRGISDQAVYNMIEKRWREAKIQRCSPHDFRRSFVTNLLDANTDLLLTQRLAGHSSPSTTKRYDRRTDETARKAAGVLHLPYSGHTIDG